MGISGLLSLLKSIQRPCSLQKFNGLTLGVDAYVWLHRGTVACAIDLALEKPTARFVEFAMSRVRMLIHYGITPYLVFDGDYLPSKGVTETDRAKRREQSKVFGLQLYRAGKISQAQAELQKAVDVTPEMAGQLIEELRKHNIQYVVAPYEADAQLVYLEKKGKIQGIISEDSDLLVFGARRLLTKLDQYGDCVEINRDDFTACKDVSLIGWTDAEFRRMAILSGCDYLPNVKSLGLKTAYALVRKFQTTERIVQRLRFDAKYTVPVDYLDSFQRAELTFLHQWVFCPDAKKLLMGSPLEKCDLEDLGFLGSDLDPSIARAVAAGRLHPTTKQPLVVPNVPLRNSQSPWGASRRSQDATPDSKMGKPIDRYFKQQRVPLAELDPNSFTPSPSQRALQATPNRSWLSSPVTSNVPRTTPSIRAPTSATSLRRISATPSRLGDGPVKRPRLCSNEEKGPDGKSPEHIRSRFFSGATPLSAKANRGKSKRDPVNIWSDGSIDEAFASLPDLTAPLATPKVPIFTDEKPVTQTATKSSPPTLTEEGSVSTRSRPKAQALEKSSPAETPSLSSSNVRRESSKSLQASAAGIPKWGAQQTQCHLNLVNSVAHQATDADVVPESPSIERRPARPAALESSLTSSLSPVRGSEDVLVLQSDDESPPTSPLSLQVPRSPKLDLGRFMFAGL